MPIKLLGMLRTILDKYEKGCPYSLTNVGHIKRKETTKARSSFGDLNMSTNLGQVLKFWCI